MRTALHNFLVHIGVDVAKFSETITRAWIMAVRHFMEKTETAASFDEFIEQNKIMLDTSIMLTHYSAELLFSDEARASFLEPDKDPIPRYDK